MGGTVTLYPVVGAGASGLAYARVRAGTTGAPGIRIRKDLKEVEAKGECTRRERMRISRKKTIG